MKNQVVVDELRRLAALHNGMLQPRVVVEAASHKDSPLHSHFQWDDSAAALSWRLHQARQLINVVVTAYRDGDGAETEARVFVSLTSDRSKTGDGYRVLATVLSDEAQRAQLLADAKQDMIAFKVRYRILVELAAVFDAIDEVVEQPQLVET